MISMCLESERNRYICWFVCNRSRFAQRHRPGKCNIYWHYKSGWSMLLSSTVQLASMPCNITKPHSYYVPKHMLTSWLNFQFKSIKSKSLPQRSHVWGDVYMNPLYRTETLNKTFRLKPVHIKSFTQWFWIWVCQNQLYLIPHDANEFYSNETNVSRYTHRLYIGQVVVICEYYP